MVKISKLQRFFHVENEHFDNITFLGFNFMVKDKYFLIHAIETQPVCVRPYKESIF